MTGTSSLNTLRVVGALVAVLATGPSLHAQLSNPAFLFREDALDWRVWEAPLAGHRDELLTKLGICDNRLVREQLHLVDFTGDGLVDLVYSGAIHYCDAGGNEGTVTFLYHNRAGKLIQIAHLQGEITRLLRPLPGQPVTVEVTDRGCCGNLYVMRALHVPGWKGDSLTYQESTTLQYTQDTDLPKRYFPAPRPFRVSQERYKLRVAPQVDDTTSNALGDATGNTVEVYGRGAAGLALADTTDATGRTWWFVLMDAATPPRPQRPGGTATRGYHAGWMSSRFLEPIDPKPTRPAKTHWPIPHPDSTTY